MSASSKLTNSDSPADDGGQLTTSDHYSATYQPMAELQAKLLALDYSKAFVAAYKCPPVNRYYFCRPGQGAGQQFFAFTSLASFLLNRLNQPSGDFKVDSFDDPNLTIDRILNAAGAHVDTSAFANARAKFKAGFGAEVIGLLSRLADKLFLKELPSLERGSVTIKFLNADGRPLDEENNDDDDNEDGLDNQIEDDEIEMEEEFADYIIDETMGDDGMLAGIGGEDDGWDDDNDSDPFNAAQHEKAMIVAHSTDLTEWKLELERVLPQLNARLLGQSMLRGGGGGGNGVTNDTEWRLHYATATAQSSTIKGVYGQTAALVASLSADIGSALEKIDAKEAYLRSNCATILAEWATVRERAERLRVAFEAVHTETSDKSARLADLGEEDRTVKQALEEYSLRMTDSSPLLEAKKAREALKAELVAVNLQIGVAIQTLVRHITLYTSPVY